MDILVVDDVESDGKLLAKILTNLGYSCSIAQSGEQALDIIKKNQVEMVLMNLSMPILDGFQTTHIIRQELYNPIPIVGYSSDVTLDQKDACMRVGMNTFIAKPIQLNSIKELLVSLGLRVHLENESE